MRSSARSGATARSVVLSLVAAVVVGAWVAGVWPWAAGRGWQQGGPVLVPDPHGYVARYRDGEVFTDGFERIILTGDRPGMLHRVELEGPDADALEVVGVLLAGPDRSVGSWQVSDGFPPSRAEGLGRLVPAEGAVLPTGRVGSLLQIGIRVTEPGLLVRTGVRIYYTVGEDRYTVLLPAAIAVCPPRMADEACMAAYEDVLAG